jgi:hypothetical protein
VRARIKNELGEWAGNVAGLLGVHARVGQWWFAGNGELTGLAHSAETRARARGERATTLSDRAHRTERERGAHEREAGADRSATPAEGERQVRAGAG